MDPAFKRTRGQKQLPVKRTSPAHSWNWLPIRFYVEIDGDPKNTLISLIGIILLDLIMQLIIQVMFPRGPMTLLRKGQEIFGCRHICPQMKQHMKKIGAAFLRTGRRVIWKLLHQLLSSAKVSYTIRTQVTWNTTKIRAIGGLEVANMV